MPDAVFAHPRLADVYDAVDSDRTDLRAYLALVRDLGVRSVLDIGCGTGTFACLLADREMTVTAVDPAEASLNVARRKGHADRVRWVLGDAAALPPLQVDMATMTGNVAQVFLTDDEWMATLHRTRLALEPRGWLVFETRDPAAAGWEAWTPERTYRRVHTLDGVTLDTWTEVTDASLPYVSLRTTFQFNDSGDQLTSDSTLRFRSRDEISDSLWKAGLVVEDMRDAPDRPGLEMVFLAHRRNEK